MLFVRCKTRAVDKLSSITQLISYTTDIQLKISVYNIILVDLKLFSPTLGGQLKFTVRESYTREKRKSFVRANTSV